MNHIAAQGSPNSLIRWIQENPGEIAKLIKQAGKHDEVKEFISLSRCLVSKYLVEFQTDSH